MSVVQQLRIPSALARRGVPPAAGWAVRRVRELVELAPGTGRRQLPSGAPAVPPRRLRGRAGVPDAVAYADGGRRAAQELASALRAAGHELPESGAILDFGCGAGRVLPHVGALVPGATCTGCDVDRTAIDWAAAHRPGARWVLSSFEPPLPFADGSFDLIYSISVFSHLGGALADRWLGEVARILRPGGVALLSVHGPSAFDAFRSGAARTGWCPPEMFVRGPLRDGDFVFAPYRRTPWTVGDLPGIGTEYGLAFHGHDYLRRTWSRRLEVGPIALQAVTGWQDLVVCTRR